MSQDSIPNINKQIKSAQDITKQIKQSNPRGIYITPLVVKGRL